MEEFASTHKQNASRAKGHTIARAHHAERKAGERLGVRDDPTSCVIDYQQDEVEFMMALDKYKRKMKRPFPTCREVLNVLKSLGYTKSPQQEAKDGTATSNDDPGAEKAVG